MKRCSNILKFSFLCLSAVPIFLFSGTPNKCGFSHAASTAMSARFQKNETLPLEKIQAPPVTQKSRVIGHFRIYYDTIGIHQPALLNSSFQRLAGTAEQYIDSVGKFFNIAWSYEIDTLGYGAPPLELNGSYHVFIQDMGDYGVTNFSTSLNSSEPYRYMTYIEVDNDYQSTPSHGMNGLKVTSAHEFFHAIQVGVYGFWSNDVYFYEIAGTWMEDAVFDEVNDYYFYLSNSDLSSPGINFLSNGSIAYGRAIWGKFLEKRFSRNVIHRTWEIMASNQSLNAMDTALIEAGSSFRQAFIEYARWNSTTGPTCDTINYYTEGRHYPSITIASSPYNHPADSISGNIQAVANAYHTVTVDSNPMLAILTHFDFTSAYTTQNFSFKYHMKDIADPSYKHLTNGLYVKLEAPDIQNWNTWESASSISSVSNDYFPSIIHLQQNFPNPFNPLTTIRYSLAKEGRVTVLIFNILGQEVERLVDCIQYTGEYEVFWKADRFSSGTYLCRLTMGDYTSVKKLILLK